MEQAEPEGQPSVGGGAKWTMSVELSVLESLGINLYSNAAAVLSELVANAYDADSNKVTIAWQQSGEPKVVVTDDGCGMTAEEINKRFLTAGYKKRDNEGTTSPKFCRPFMGRKGIGKLSVFSIAREITVYSTKEGGEPQGLRIESAALEAAIKAGHEYHPIDVPEIPDEYSTNGTTIVMTDLKTKRAALTASALRKRLARRFNVMDERTPEEGQFVIEIDGKPLSWADRQELKRLEFLWEFGTQTLASSVLPTGITRFTLPTDVVNAAEGWKVGGWFGTARKPTDLTDDPDAGSLKNIIVLARGRPIQEGIIEKLDFSRLFGNYVTGQVTADFLDLDDQDDIATSDRQRLMEDDERVEALQAFLRDCFVKAADQWSEARPKKIAKDVLANYPKLKEWVTSRPEWQRPAAETMIGTIAGLELEKKNEAEDRSALLRSGILAFERVGLRQAATDLEQLSKVTAIDLLPLLGEQETYEAGLWVDILRSRVKAIEQLKQITDTNEKEKVLQEHLFNHLWLLDASWERATGSETMEENLRKIAPGIFAMDEHEKEITGRVDIRYATVSGRHVIVELKRYGVNPDAIELAEQGTKYANALASILEQQQRDSEIANIEIIFVLGSAPGHKLKGPSGSARDYFEDTFRSFRGSYRLYDALIHSAQNQYDEYLAASGRAQELDDLLSSIKIEAGPVAADPPAPS